MSDDYRVKPRSDQEITVLAKLTREKFGLKDAERIDVIECLRSGFIHSLIGKKPLELRIISDHLMKGDHGRTRYDGKIVTIDIARSIRHRAYMGDGYARNTFAHELGHGVMHIEYMTNGVAMARQSMKVLTPGWIKPFESAEHQAKIFAAAFLINDEVAKTLDTEDEISITFGISRMSASIYLKQRNEINNREQTYARVQKLAAEFRASVASKAQPERFMNDCCSVCGKQTVFPVGHKYMCKTCDTIYDRFQDGDRVD